MATGQASDVLGHALLNHVPTDPSLTPPTTTYMAFCTATPTKALTAATIAEANYTNYARRASASSGGNNPDWNPAASDRKENAVVLSFAQSGSGPEVLKAVCLVSSGPARLTAGDLYWWAMLASPVKAGIAEQGDNLIHCPAHGFSNGNKVVFDADTLPGGVLRDTEYTVASATTDTFALTEVADITSTAHILVGLSKWITVNNLSIPQFDVGQLSWSLV